MMELFFFFSTSSEPWLSESEDDEADFLRRIDGVAAFATRAVAFSSATYLTFIKIFRRKSPGLGRCSHSLERGLTSRPFQTCSIISTMISCCSFPACTSRLTMTGRSLKFKDQPLILCSRGQIIPVSECRVADRHADISKRNLFCQSVPVQYSWLSSCRGSRRHPRCR